MINEEKSNELIINFANEYLLPLLQRYHPYIKEDFDYKYFMDNQINLRKIYTNICENACKLFEFILDINITHILKPHVYNNYFFSNSISNNSLDGSYLSGNSIKTKRTYAKEQNKINNIEMEITKKIVELNDNNKSNINNKNMIFPDYKSYESLGEPDCSYNLYPQNQNVQNNMDIEDGLKGDNFENQNNSKLFNDYLQPFGTFLEESNNFNSDYNDYFFSSQSNNNNNNNNDFIEPNENVKNINISEKNILSGKKSKRGVLNSSKLNNNKSFSIEDSRKKKIKEFHFREIKRENIDKKIIRKFKKYLKSENTKLNNLELIHYVNNSEFWSDFINSNLMPPFNYAKENKGFKSFNTQYLKWFFEHKFSLELYNLFIKDSYNSLLILLKKSNYLNEGNEDYSLLKIYLKSLPLIYGKDEQQNNDKDIEMDEDEDKSNSIKNHNNRMETDNDFMKDNYELGNNAGNNFHFAYSEGYFNDEQNKEQNDNEKKPFNEQQFFENGINIFDKAVSSGICEEYEEEEK